MAAAAAKVLTIIVGLHLSPLSIAIGEYLKERAYLSIWFWRLRCPRV